MVLGDVVPLDSAAEALWAAITSQYIDEEIKRVNGRLVAKAEVSVGLVSQYPPFAKSETAVSKRIHGDIRHRNLQDVEQDLTSGTFEPVEQELTFDVLILLQSVVTDHDINRYIVGAFNEDSEKMTYLLDLRKTGHPAFAKASSVFVMGAIEIESLEDDSFGPGIYPAVDDNSPKRRGLAAGLTVLAVIGMGLAAFFFMKGRRQRQQMASPPLVRRTNLPGHGFDSVIEVGTRTDVSSLGDPFPPDIHDISSTTESRSTSKSSGPPTLDYDFVQEFRQSSSSQSRSLGDTNSASLVTKDDNTLEAEYFQFSRYEVEAPPGRLGIVLATSDGGAPVVQAISDSSPLIGQIREGDILLMVDGIDVTDMMASDVSNLIASKQSNSARIFFMAMSPPTFEASLN